MAVYDINRILVPDAPPEYEDHTRDVHYVPAPCQVACPIGTDAPSYIAYIWDGAPIVAMLPIFINAAPSPSTTTIGRSTFSATPRAIALAPPIDPTW